jgi:hypothetical protein
VKPYIAEHKFSGAQPVSFFTHNAYVVEEYQIESFNNQRWFVLYIFWYCDDMIKAVTISYEICRYEIRHLIFNFHVQNGLSHILLENSYLFVHKKFAAEIGKLNS